MQNFECRLIKGHFKTNSTIGEFCFIADQDLICIVGGDNEQILMHTSKKTGADPCHLGDKCKIRNSLKPFPVQWIGCDSVDQYCAACIAASKQWETGRIEIVINSMSLHSPNKTALSLENLKKRVFAK